MMLDNTLVWSVLETTKTRFPTALFGVWRAVHRAQGWHRLEVLHGGLVLVQLESGAVVSGKLECHSDQRCTMQLDMNSTPLTLEGSWCLWHGSLDFCFLGEYLLFMPVEPQAQPAKPRAQRNLQIA